MKKGWLIAIIIFTGFIFSGSVYSEEQKNVNTTNTVDSGDEAFKVKVKQEELYKKALSLKEDDDYDAAQGILNKLVTDNPGIDKYEISYVDVILDQSLAMKEAKNMAWSAKVKETALTIKRLRRTNTQNAYYYYVFAKYSWIIETNRDANIFKPLKRAIYLRPDFPEAYILQGDAYFEEAKNAPRDEQARGIGNFGNSNSGRFTLADTAKSSYMTALSSGSLSDKRKAYVFYKMGDLETQIFDHKDAARTNWDKAVKLAPNSKAGQLAKQHLER